MIVFVLQNQLFLVVNCIFFGVEFKYLYEYLIFFEIPVFLKLSFFHQNQKRKISHDFIGYTVFNHPEFI